MGMQPHAGDKGPAVNPLAALLNGIPGFDTAQLEELLGKLPMHDDEEVLGITMSEAVVVVLYAMLFNRAI